MAALCNASRLSMNAISLLPWLADYLMDAGDLRDVQLLALGVVIEAGQANEGGVAGRRGRHLVFNEVLPLADADEVMIVCALSGG